MDDPDALPPPPPELMEPFEKIEEEEDVASLNGIKGQGSSQGPSALLEGSVTLPRHRNVMSLGRAPTTLNVLGPGDQARGTRAVLTTSSLDRRLVARPKSLVDRHDPGPWVPMPPPRNIVPAPPAPAGQPPTPPTTENGHVISSDDDQVSPTEDMPIGRPVIASQSTPSEPPDFDNTDPTISW